MTRVLNMLSKITHISWKPQDVKPQECSYLDKQIGMKQVNNMLKLLSPFELQEVASILKKPEDSRQFFDELAQSVSGRLIVSQRRRSRFTPYEINNRLRDISNFFDFLERDLEPIAKLAMWNRNYKGKEVVDAVLQKSLESSGILQNVAGVTNEDLAFLSPVNIGGSGQDIAIISFYHALAGKDFFNYLQREHREQYDGTRDDVEGLYYPDSKSLTDLIYHARPIPISQYASKKDEGLYTSCGFYMRDEGNESGVGIKIRDYQQAEYLSSLSDFAEKVVGIKGVTPYFD